METVNFIMKMENFNLQETINMENKMEFGKFIMRMEI